ncbi:MAG: hypothetical protein M3O30_06260 [Planctomycetota bacterium]|nr:hypothetical protein [Planctomycetota bacterium]
MLRWVLYLWAFPTTLLGLVLAGVTLLSGGRAQVVQGVLEICGGASEFYLRRVVGLVLHGGASAMTLGHVVLGRDLDLLEATRAHERVHVRQCERWGPLFVPVYLGASLVAWMRGRRPYEDNFLEREAFQFSA